MTTYRPDRISLETTPVVRGAGATPTRRTVLGGAAGLVVWWMAPVLAALGAFAALVTECTIEVEKVDEKAK